MKNVAVKVEGSVMTITVDLTKRYGLSSTGKTTIVASTEGAVKLDGEHDGIGYSFTVWSKEPRR